MTIKNGVVLSVIMSIMMGCSTTPDKPDPLTAAPTAESELERMQGSWRASLIAHEDPAMEATITFAGSAIDIMPSQEGMGIHIKGTITLDPAQPVRAITLAISEGEGEEAKNTSVRGRYAWGEDGGLTMCFPKDEDDPAPNIALPCDAPDLVRFTLAR